MGAFMFISAHCGLFDHLPHLSLRIPNTCQCVVGCSYEYPYLLAVQNPHVGMPLAFGICGRGSCAECFSVLSGGPVVQEAALSKLSRQKGNNESSAEE